MRTFFIIFVLAAALQKSSSAVIDSIMNDTFNAWNAFRDPRNGLWCDTIYFENAVVCGPGNEWYSSAGTGMGLISDAVMAELGFLDRQTAENRSLQTLTTIWNSWPRESFSGFYIHWTTSVFDIISEFSTIDTAEMVLGALFAGNYFGGEIQAKAEQVRAAIV